MSSARSYSPCPGVQAGGARGEGGPDRPGGRGGQGRGLDVLQPHHRHPSPPRLPSHQAHTPPREGEGGANEHDRNPFNPIITKEGRIQ